MAAQAGFDVDLGGIVEQVAQEKGIDKQILIETMEAAILKAAQAAFGPNRELEARFNEDSGHIDLFQYMTVVEEVEDTEREIALDVARKHGLGIHFKNAYNLYAYFWRWAMWKVFEHHGDQPGVIDLDAEAQRTAV